VTTADVEVQLQRLRRAHPGWLILFGTYTRRFVAHGYMLGRSGIWVTAATSAELDRRMALLEKSYPCAERITR
jgi:hypothetical protein